MDTLTSKERSERMSRIRGCDTVPEMTVRRLVHGMGYRYRLHRRDLPGCPDLVFPSRRKVIFVNGCFWHRHEGCHLARMPKSRVDYWREKLEGNAERDRKNIAKLDDMGWQSLVIWECELKEIDVLRRRIREFLEQGRSDIEGG